MIEEFVAGELVDDDRYATLYVTDKRTLESWGSERIRQGLLRRGVDRDTVDRALAATETMVLPGAATRRNRGPRRPRARRRLAGPGRNPVRRTPEGLRRPHSVTPSWDAPSPCCAGASPSRRPTPAGRERALGLLLRRGYDSELALDAVHALAWED